MAKTNKGRKLFATTATAALVASAIVPVASAAEVNDINSVASYAKDAVQDLVDRGVIEGDAKGNFNPRNSVTRAEAATIFAKALDLESTGSINFSDVKSGAWYYDAIAAAVNNGVFQGQGAGKFNPSGNLTRSEAAVIYVNAFGLEGSDDLSSFKDASAVKAWATEAIQIAVANGVLKGDDKGNLNPNANITKQDFAVMFARAEAAVVDPATNLKDALEDLKTTSEKLVEKVTAENVAAAKTAVADAKEAITAVEEALKAAQEAEVVTEEEVKTIEEAITAAKAALEKAEKAVAGYEESLTVAKVESVSATNLKEVVVTFNQVVDEESASDKASYALKSGKAIQSVSLSEDKKTATVTVVGTLANNKVDAISVSNVKAGSKVIDAKNVEFTTVDNKLPEVTSLKSLGTKSVKIEVSEPVTELKQSNFTLDGKAFFGKVTLGANNRSVILTPFSSTTLSVGDHKLAVTGVKDYAGFVSLSSTHDFTVVEDKDAPTVTEATATLESVTLTFSEDVDAETIKASNVYWKSGDSKKTANSFEAIADNKYKFFFKDSESLPTGKVDVYVEGVKDFSDNQIAKDTKVSVTPEIDQTRPEVRKVSVQDSKTIKVTFSKAINADSAKEVKNYTVLNKDGKVVSVQSAALDPQDSKSVIVNLYTDLSTGENTLTIKNIKDATKLQNTMLDYSEKIVRADKNHPEFDSKVVNTNDRRVVLKFNKKMNVETLVDYSNYLVEINGKLQTLNSDFADISVFQDGTAVVITFAETIDGKATAFATSALGKTNVSKLQVLGVKDAAGNLLNEFANPTVPAKNIVDLTSDTTLALDDIDSDYTGYKAELVDTKTVKVKFNAGVNSASAGAFSYTVGGVEQVKDVEVDGTSTVTVKFKEDLGTAATGLNLDINLNKLVTIAGYSSTTLGNVSIDNNNLLDTVAPEITDKGAYAVAGNQITINYSEGLNLNSLAAGNQDLIDTDFTVTRVSDNKKLNPIGDYNVNIVGGNKIVITLTDGRKVDSAYKVTVDGAKYINDGTAAKNVIKNSVGESAKLVATTTITGTLNQTTPGVAPTPGTPAVQGIDTVTFGGTFAPGEVITIDGTFLPGLTTGTTAAATATEVAALVAANTTLNAKYTVVDDSAGKLTFTEKAGQESAAALTVGTNSTSGTTVATLTTAGVPLVSPTPGTAQVETLTVAGTALISGNITVTFTAGGTPVVKTVAVTAGDTADVVAGKINTAFSTGLTGWTATNASGTANVVFTASPAAANTTVTVTVAN